MKPRILIVDNYDSFTHNVAAALMAAGADCTVVVNDAASPSELCAHAADGFVISAGPCTPLRAGASLPLVSLLAEHKPRVPLLGLCLGHQAIALAGGARLRRAREPMHGKLASLRHDASGILAAVPSPIPVARYNSLVVDETSLPSSLVINARDEHDDIMALRHVSLPHTGLQFHPESWLCPEAVVLLAAWLETTTEVAHPSAVRQAHAP